MASQLIEEVTAHAQSDGLKDTREICADGAYFQNYLREYTICILDIIISLKSVITNYLPYHTIVVTKITNRHFWPLRSFAFLACSFKFPFSFYAIWRLAGSFTCPRALD